MFCSVVVVVVVVVVEGGRCFVASMILPYLPPLPLALARGYGTIIDPGPGPSVTPTMWPHTRSGPKWTTNNASSIEKEEEQNHDRRPRFPLAYIILPYLPPGGAVIQLTLTMVLGAQQCAPTHDRAKRGRPTMLCQ